MTTSENDPSLRYGSGRGVGMLAFAGAVAVVGMLAEFGLLTAPDAPAPAKTPSPATATQDPTCAAVRPPLLLDC